MQLYSIYNNTVLKEHKARKHITFNEDIHKSLFFSWGFYAITFLLN